VHFPFYSIYSLKRTASKTIHFLNKKKVPQGDIWLILRMSIAIFKIKIMKVLIKNSVTSKLSKLETQKSFHLLVIRKNIEKNFSGNLYKVE
jgi:hypothetical protein